MPSDQDENRAGWQDISALQSMQWALPEEADIQPAVDDQSVQEPVDTDDLLAFDDDPESDLLNWTRQPLVSKESMMSFGRQFSPVLIPLPFAAIVFCLTLPVTLRGNPLFSLLATSILFAALTILQGIMLYFAGANDTLWMLYIVLGYALFVLAGVLVALGLGAALITLVALLLLGLFLARRGVHPTKEGYVDLVESFGKYTHTLYPGLNLLLPWEKVSLRLNIQETIWTCPLQRVPTSREQDVQLTATISYQLLPEDAHLAALTVQDWEGALQKQFIGTVQSVVNELTPNDFVSWTQSVYMRTAGESNSFNPAAATRWDRICSALSRRMQDQVAGWGCQINWVRIQDLTILPAIPGAAPGIEGGTTQFIKPEPAVASVTSSPAPAVAHAGEAAHPVKAAAHAEPSRGSGPAPSSKAITVETLVDFYNAVRQNAITDPVMILDIAQRFESLGKDPVQGKSFPFDADRAAATLRNRASKLQELAQARTVTSSSTSNSPAQGS